MSSATVAPLETTTATGVPNGKLGMWLFLASEVMFFTALIGAYLILRLGHPAWPGPEGHLSVPIGTCNTLILICSSTTIVLALAAAQRAQAGDPSARALAQDRPERDGGGSRDESRALAAVRGWVALTMVLGASFLVIKGFEYAAKFSHHIGPSTNLFWGCYFVLTGFHGLHVLGGIIFNLVVLTYARSARAFAARGRRLELAGLYWHFVDIVWIFLFPLLYLL